MSQDIVRISMLENGWEVECYHKPKPRKPNEPYSYESDWKCYGFDSADKVMKFLKDQLPTLSRRMSGDEEYASGFKEATAKAAPSKK